MKDNYNSIGLLILRVAFGASMLTHGIPKIMGFSKIAEKFPDPIGLGSQLSLALASAAEVGCSLLLILGLCTRFASIPLAFTMLVALLFVHGSDPWKAKELAALYFAVYLSIAFLGAGKFSLDYKFWGKDKL